MLVYFVHDRDVLPVLDKHDEHRNVAVVRSLRKVCVGFVKTTVEDGFVHEEKAVLMSHHVGQVLVPLYQVLYQEVYLRVVCGILYKYHEHWLLDVSGVVHQSEELEVLVLMLERSVFNSKAGEKTVVVDDALATIEVSLGLLVDASSHV